MGRTPKMKYCERKAKQHPKVKLDRCSSDIAGIILLLEIE